MKKLLLLLVTGFSISCVWSQQPAGGGFRRAGTNQQVKGMHKRQLKDSLGLTDDQVDKVDAIQQDYKLKMRAVKLDTQLNDTARKDKLDEMKQERFDKLSAVISKEQLEKLDGMKKPVKKVKPKTYRRHTKKV